MSLVLDTGPVMAALDADDADHAVCAALLAEADEPLVVPSAILVEVEYWCRTRVGRAAWQTFTEDLVAGAYRLVSLQPEGVRRAAELTEQYADLGLGYVDASVVATCEVLDEPKVATLDARHFTVVRPAHVDTLELRPR